MWVKRSIAAIAHKSLAFSSLYVTKLEYYCNQQNFTVRLTIVDNLGNHQGTIIIILVNDNTHIYLYTSSGM